MDKISIENMEIYAYHGVYEDEKKEGQTFIISADLYTDIKKAASSDDLDDTVNYAYVCETIEKAAKDERCDLIETVAENIATAILKEYRGVKKAVITVKKPNAPIPYPFENVGVTVERSRHTVYLGVGSNLGDREGYLDFAADQLAKDEYIEINKVSSYINTAPYGPVEQDDFLNAAVEIETLHTPQELLSIVNDIEKEAGRKRIIHWGPRTLDIDILLFDDEIISEENLSIPHPEMAKRDFVLQPLNEIAPYVMHPVLKKTVKELYEDIIEDSKNQIEPFDISEYKIIESISLKAGDKVVYAGVPGAYAEQAMYKYFGYGIDSYNVKEFNDVVTEVKEGRAKYGIIPIENSSAGFVSGSYDTIRHSGVNIVGEVIVDINHALLGINGAEISDIKKVYSHPQGLLQCEEYIEKHGFFKVSMENTAAAAKRVKEAGLKDCAAIASERSAELYGLKILDRRINFSSDNATRFAVVTGEKIAAESADKIVICFSMPDKCGSLYQIIGCIMEHGLNMNSIESRPSLKKKWQYDFYVSFEGKLTDENVLKALGEIKIMAEYLIILGTY